MNFSNMNVKALYETYNKKAPKRKTTINGKPFVYRYYKNPKPEKPVTIVTLAGGSGLGDGFFLFSEEIAKHYSFISFNYPMAFQNNIELVDAMAELFHKLSAENVYLFGQSYGGALAQIMAKQHPDSVKGLILSATASMSNDLRFEGMQCLVRMFDEKKEEKNHKIDKMLPLGLLAPAMKMVFKKHITDPDGQKVISELVDVLRDDMTNDYFYHMDSLLGDLRNHLGTHHKEDFTKFDNEVLLFLPEDDKIFTPDIREALRNIMTNPEIAPDIEGGHLAMLTSADEYFSKIFEFVDKRN
ncbi:MAG: alpha/beta hydrolase [Oscillospiraceae bacterium]